MCRLLYLTIWVLLLVPFPASSQYRILGFRGGYNNAGVALVQNGATGAGLDRRGGFAGGITYEYLTPSNLSIGVDMLYERRGFISTTSPVFTSQPIPGLKTITQRFNYGHWSVPIRASYYLGEKLFGFGSVGLVPSLMLGARQKTKEVYSDGSSSRWSKDKASPSSRFDLSGWLEAGVGYRMSWFFWPYISVAYQPGITSFRERAFDPEAVLRYQVWNVSIGTKLEFVKVRWSAKD